MAAASSNSSNPYIDVITSSAINFNGYTLTTGGGGRFDMNGGISGTGAAIVNGGCVFYTPTVAFPNNIPITVNAGVLQAYGSVANFGPNSALTLNAGGGFNFGGSSTFASGTPVNLNGGYFWTSHGSTSVSFGAMVLGGGQSQYRLDNNVGSTSSSFTRTTAGANAYGTLLAQGTARPAATKK